MERLAHSKLLKTLIVGTLRFIYIKFAMPISSRISAVPAYTGLRQFPDGRGFKQWTGDDSKALMKVRFSSNLVMTRSLDNFYVGLHYSRSRPCPSGNGQMPFGIYELLLYSSP
jgi:hypothetical protein